MLLAAAFLLVAGGPSSEAASKKSRRPRKAAPRSVSPKSPAKASTPPAAPAPKPLPAARPPKPRRPRETPRIRRIRVVRRDIFDTHIPDEDKKVFRLVNALHVTTKESAIRAQLLFKEGDIYNADLAKESERAVRGILRLRNVRVTPVPVDAGTVDLLVSAQETWTTEPVFSLSGVGANLNLKAGVRERNLLGFGKKASLFYRKTDGIISREVSYEDPALLGTPLAMDAEYQDREDGTLRFLSLRKPFRSSITPWFAGGEFTDDKSELRQLDNLGNDVGLVRSELWEAGGSAAVSAWSTTKVIRRPGLGYKKRKESTEVILGTAAARSDLYHIFSVQWGWERVRFLTVNHIDQYDRDEDFTLGPSLNFSAGFSRHKWVRGSENANFFEGRFVQGRTFGLSHFGQFTLTGKGKYQTERWRAAVAGAELKYFNHFQPRQTLALHLGWETIVNPGPADQLLLGGDTGLRAYKVNQFAGNKKLLLNAENRFFVIDDILSFMSLGAVVFGDAGYVWAAGRSPRMKDVKADFGTGLRFYLNRTSVGHVLRLDVAYAAKRVKEQERIVLSFGSSHAF
jgi:hypothetical protein